MPPTPECLPDMAKLLTSDKNSQEFLLRKLSTRVDRIFSNLVVHGDVFPLFELVI
jgi:hypothetical protein